MKIKLPCEIVRDLLPGYIDSVLSSLSREAVTEHLLGCEECSRLKDSMQNGNQDLEGLDGGEEEDKILMKKIRKRLNRKLKIAVLCFAVSIVILFGAFQILFRVPLKEVPLSDISVSATVYPIEDIKQEGDGSVTISMGEEDTSEVFSVAVPELGGSSINISEEAAEKSGNVITAVTVSSLYFLRDISYADVADAEEDTIYISAFKTTLLGNRAQDYNSSTVSMDMRKISKIVYVDDSGKQTVLWEMR